MSIFDKVSQIIQQGKEMLVKATPASRQTYVRTPKVGNTQFTSNPLVRDKKLQYQAPAVQKPVFGVPLRPTAPLPSVATAQTTPQTNNETVAQTVSDIIRGGKEAVRLGGVLGKEVVQGTARTTATVGITAGNLATPGQPFPSEIDPKQGGRFARTLLGDTTVKDILTYGKAGVRGLNELTGAKLPENNLVGLPLAGLGIAMDLSGGGKPVKKGLELINEAQDAAKAAKLKTGREVIMRDVSGAKFTVPANTVIEPRLDGSKAIIEVDGKTYTVPKNQYDNLKGQSLRAEATPFAPELKDTTETVLGGKPKQNADSIAWEGPKENMTGKIGNRTFGITDEGDGFYVYEKDGLLGAKKKTYSEATEELNRYLAKDTPATKYAGYQLPGGENYREILIKAPTKAEVSPAKKALDDLEKDGITFEDEMDGNSYPVRNGEAVEYDELTPEQQRLMDIATGNAEDTASFKNNIAGGYKSSHWDEPNVISHIRANERVIDGKKHFFLEELQSDWARDARSKEGIPDNPLLKNWQIPTTKRALMEAVNSGADRFAWINGKQTSERYNLATHVDNVRWKKGEYDKGINEIRITPISGGDIVLYSDNNGLVYKASQNSMEGKKLDEVLGKGLADKIMEKTDGTLSGDGLSFGGEWASNLYDRQLRDIVKKLTGADVKTGDMGLGDGNKQLAGYKRDLELLETGKDVVNREAKIDALKKTISDFKGEIQTQQYIDLTPEVKARIAGEAPKFKLADYGDNASIPLIFRAFLDDTAADRTITDVAADLKRIFKTDNIPLVGVKEFADDPKKLGEMNKGVISILQLGDKVSDVVAKHESWHLFKQGMVTKAERAFITEMEQDLMKRSPKAVNRLRKAGYKEADLAEELMADEFARYYRTGVTFSSKLAAFFDRLIQRVEMLLKNKTEVLAYFKNVSGQTTGRIKGQTGPAKQKLNPIDSLIAENKVRVVSRDGRDVYQVKKGGQWVNKRDEDSAIRAVTPKSPIDTIKTARPKRYASDATEQRVLAAEIAKEALDANPAKQLSRFVAKRGDFKGTLAEVTGYQKRKNGLGTDVYMADAGFDTSEDARKAYDEYRARKIEVDEELRAAKARRRLELAKPKVQEGPKVRQMSRSRDVARWEQEATNLRVREAKRIAAQTEPQFQSVLNEPTRLNKERVKQQEESALLSQGQDLPSVPRKIDPLADIVTKTPLDRKVNIIDYLRTPDRVLNKIGFGKEARLLRSQYEKYSMELPKNIDKISEWVKRVPKDASERLFQHLDGKAVKLSPAEQKVADEIRAYLKDWADRLGLPEENRVANYITRLFDDQLIKKEFDEDLAKIISGKIPGEVYNPFLQKRLGAKGYKQDVWGALDAYTKRATRKVHIDPALERIQSKAGSSLEFTFLEESQFKYIERYIARVQMRPTEVDNVIDNSVKQLLGYRFGQRPVTTVSRFLRRMTYRGMLGGNLSSAIRNLSQGVNTYSVLGEKYTAVGYAKLLQPASRKELIEQGIFNNNFIEDRVLSSTKKMLQKGDKALWAFFDTAEKLNRGSAYLGAKAKGIGKGMSEEQAIEYAKGIVRKTQFSYDAVDQPVALGSDIMKTLFQFQTYTTKQTEFLLGMVKDKNVIGLLRYGIAGVVFVNTVGKALGMTEAELVPLWQNITGERKNSLAPSLKFPVEAVKAVAGTPDKYGNDRTTEEKVNDVGKSLIGIIPGGSQIKKTYEGMKAVEEDGSFDAAGRKQFDQGDSAASKVQSILFGKYASQAAKDYFDKKTSTGDKELDKVLKEDKKTKKAMQSKVETQVSLLSTLSPEEQTARLKVIAETDKDFAIKLRDRLREEKAKKTWSDVDKGIAKLGVESGARAAYVYKKMKELPPEERNAYIKDLRERKVISDEVFEQIKELHSSNATIE